MFSCFVCFVALGLCWKFSFLQRAGPYPFSVRILSSLLQIPYLSNRTVFSLTIHVLKPCDEDLILPDISHKLHPSLAHSVTQKDSILSENGQRDVDSFPLMEIFEGKFCIFRYLHHSFLDQLVIDLIFSPF